ncbi:hypothetical protein JCM17823_05800 [Halorubrum gandharaense]
MSEGSEMGTLSVRARLVAVVAGLAHLLVVEALFRWLGHVPETLWPLASVGNAVVVFAFGFLVGLVTVGTRLWSPTVGLVTLLAWAAYRDVTAPAPEWSELGGHLVVDGAVYLTSYVSTWYVWVATFVVLGTIEYGLRRQYELADDRLRNLPPLPTRRRTTLLAAGVIGGLFGVAVVAWMAGVGVSPASVLPLLVVTTALAGAVPVGAAVARGVVTPTVCFLLLVVPPLLRQTFVGGEGGPVFLLMLGPLAVGFAVVGYVEHVLRSRFRNLPGGEASGADQ